MGSTFAVPPLHSSFSSCELELPLLHIPTLPPLPPLILPLPFPLSFQPLIQGLRPLTSLFVFSSMELLVLSLSKGALARLYTIMEKKLLVLPPLHLLLPPTKQNLLLVLMPLTSPPTSVLVMFTPFWCLEL